MLTVILIVFPGLACFTLILVILLQVGRGHGLSGASFSQGGVQTVFGTKTADFLSKATSVMAIVFMITCISIDITYSRRSRSLFGTSGRGANKIDMEKLKEALEKIKAEQAKKGTPATESKTEATQPIASQSAPAATTPTPQAALPQQTTTKSPAEPVSPAKTPSKVG